MVARGRSARRSRAPRHFFVAFACEIVVPKEYALPRLERPHDETGDDRLGWPARPAEPLGRARTWRHFGRSRRHRERLPRNEWSLAGIQRARRRSQLLEPALLRPAHGAAHVRGAVFLLPLYLHLRDPGRQKPPARNRLDPDSRYPSVGADPGLPVV